MDAEEIAAGRARWQARFDKARTRDADFTTLSGVEVGLETYTSRSQLWNGTAGTLMRSPKIIGVAMAIWAAREDTPPTFNTSMEKFGPESIPKARKPASITVLPKKV